MLLQAYEALIGWLFATSIMAVVIGLPAAFALLDRWLS